VSDPVENSLPPGALGKAAAAAGPAESFAVVVAPVTPADGVPYNRVALVLNVLTSGRAIKAYRAQLEAALKTLDAAVQTGASSVEITLKAPEDLTRPRKGGEVDPGKKGKVKESGKSKDKASPKKKKKA
ncbi:MAG TPA: hypothetical protein VFL86_09785, partial [Burkholderiaceae bacterium]|nr:hypothetical protein [Burkholderiaceae bacterium]